MRPRLRLFTGDDTDESYAPTVSIKFGELSQILLDATRSDRTWIRDFENDEVEIPEDLYEVMNAYWSLRPGA